MSDIKRKILNIGKRRNLFSVFLFRFFFVSVFCFSKAQAQTNIGKETYEINDSRNPDCPCHKRQAQAEKEYSQFNINGSTGANKKNQGMKTYTLFKDKLKSSNIILSLGNHHKHLKKGKKNRIYLRKVRFRFINKIQISKKIKSDNSVCFKW